MKQIPAGAFKARCKSAILYGAETLVNVTWDKERKSPALSFFFLSAPRSESDCRTRETRLWEDGRQLLPRDNFRFARHS
jgi:hypothetical protein